MQPGFFCRTVLSTITSPNAGTTGAATADTVLTGGQKAKCYGALKGAQWTGTVSFNWGSRDAGNTFKKTFNIAVVGIRTDAKKLSEIGLSGATDAARVSAFTDGLSGAEVKALADNNFSAYRKISISLVGFIDL